MRLGGTHLPRAFEEEGVSLQTPIPLSLPSPRWGEGLRSEPQRLGLPDAGEAAHSLEQIALHGRIHREQQHGFAARGPATQMDGAYVDSRLAPRRAATAEEARLVVVDDVAHVALKIGLPLDAAPFAQQWCWEERTSVV